MYPVLANVLQPLINVNEAILNFFHGVTNSWGVAIIGLTVTVRLAILPLTFRQVKGMQQMQRLAPEMKKIQERFKDDRQRQQQELMKFYKEHNFNPLSSCLPLLLQLPFFLSLFYLQRQQEFKDEVRETGKEFLFIPDLTSKATGAVLVVLIVTYVVTQLGSSLVTAVNIQDKNQKRLMLALPFVFTVVIVKFPTGLLVYWITTNLWTIGQQLAVRRFMPAPAPVKSIDDKDSGDGGGGGGGSGGKAKRRQGMMERAAARMAGEDGKSGDGDGDRAGKATGKAKGAGGGGAAKSSGATAKGSGGSGGGNGGPRKAPPPSPRKKKKRSGRKR
ncbi:MAG TPA: membrane protein insertase YidC [Thermoleophilaceae bacterium]|jgi:YidC/Oxa1 family membrane protein insertase